MRYVLPAFRALVAKELVEKHHFSQVATAEKLGTTQAAISQYLYSKRGDKRIKQLEAIPLVQSTASEVARGIADGGRGFLMDTGYRGSITSLLRDFPR